MSVENARAFIERFDADRVFRTKISQANTDEEWLAIARKAGFDFDQNELRQIFQETPDQAKETER